MYILNNLKDLFFCVWVFGLHACVMYVCIPCACLVSVEVRRRNQGHRWLGTTMWVLGVKPRSSLRAASALNREAISSVLLNSFFSELNFFSYSILWWYLSSIPNPSGFSPWIFSLPYEMPACRALVENCFHWVKLDILKFEYLIFYGFSYWQEKCLVKRVVVGAS